MVSLLKPYWLIVVAGVVLVFVMGCASRTTQRPSADTRVAGTEEHMTHVNVGMIEFKFTIDPSSAPAGNVIFNVRNNGDAVHAFEIEGHGIERETPRLQPGETATLRIDDMQPGTYRVYCPVGNHAERGMNTEFTVTSAHSSGS